MAQGPEAAALHQKAAVLFQEWLLEEKAAQAEAEKRRKQEADDNVTSSLTIAPQQYPVQGICVES